MKNTHLLISLIFFLSVLCCKAQIENNISRNYYVSPNGNNSNTGSINNPWKTINYGQGQLSPGDTLYARGGTYVESVYILNSGTVDKPIVISAFPGEYPIIDGQNSLPNEDWGALLTLMGNYIHATGFEVKNSNITGKVRGGEGVRLRKGIHNKISFMKIHHCWDHGISAEADYAIAEDCEVFSNAMSNAAHGLPLAWANGIAFARDPINGITDHGIIRRCVVYNNHGEGVDAFEANNITIEDCLIYDNWTMNLYISDATNCLVQRNIVYNSPTSTFPVRNNYLSGITLADEVSNGTNIPHSANNVIINNFLYNADFSAFGWTLVDSTGLVNVLIANNTIVNGRIVTGASNNQIVNINSQIRNNIVVGTAKVPDAIGLTFSNNNWTITPPANAAGKGDIIGDPLLSLTGNTNPGTLTGDYFKLSSASPCINKGIKLPEVNQDFFEKKRDNFPDIGGHEFKQ